MSRVVCQPQRGAREVELQVTRRALSSGARLPSHGALDDEHEGCIRSRSLRQRQARTQHMSFDVAGLHHGAVRGQGPVELGGPITRDSPFAQRGAVPRGRAVGNDLFSLDSRIERRLTRCGPAPGQQRSGCRPTRINSGAVNARFPASPAVAGGAASGCLSPGAAHLAASALDARR